MRMGVKAYGCECVWVWMRMSSCVLHDTHMLCLTCRTPYLRMCCIQCCCVLYCRWESLFVVENSHMHTHTLSLSHTHTRTHDINTHPHAHTHTHTQTHTQHANIHTQTHSHTHNLANTHTHTHAAWKCGSGWSTTNSSRVGVAKHKSLSTKDLSSISPPLAAPPQPLPPALLLLTAATVPRRGLSLLLSLACPLSL